METNFLEAMQGTYGNVAKSLAELEQLAARFGLDAAGLEQVLKQAQDGVGRCRTHRRHDGRWAVFFHPS